MTTKKTIAILLEFGFHEIKKYIHSGFLDKISKDFEIVWLSVDKKSTSFNDYFEQTGHPLIFLDPKQFRSTSFKIEQWNRTIRDAFRINTAGDSFHNYKINSGKTLRTRLIGNSFFKTIFEYLTLQKVSKGYYNLYTQKILKEYKIDCILGQTISPFSKSLFINANKIGIKSFYLIGSWKDLYVNDFIPFRFLTKIFVWSEEMEKEHVKYMPYLDASSIKVTGNPAFDTIKSHKPKHDRKYYSKKYAISENATWIYYTMLPPGIITDEIEIIQFVTSRINEIYSEKQVVLLIRKNPNHQKEDFSNIQLPKNAILTDHYCTYDKDKDMIVQTTEGEYEWLDLLNYCSLNFSIPSTVTLEFLALNKPVVNLEINKTGKLDIKLYQYFNSGFYRPLFSSSLVYRINNINDLLKVLHKLLPTANPNSTCITDTKSATESILEELILS